MPAVAIGIADRLQKPHPRIDDPFFAAVPSPFQPTSTVRNVQVQNQVHDEAVGVGAVRRAG